VAGDGDIGDGRPTRQNRGAIADNQVEHHGISFAVRQR
jgi:hypothetical protein